MNLFAVDVYLISGCMVGAEWVHSEAALVVDLLFVRLTFSFDEGDE